MRNGRFQALERSGGRFLPKCVTPGLLVKCCIVETRSACLLNITGGAVVINALKSMGKLLD